MGNINHFTLQELAPGVHVAIAIEDGLGAAYSNAGFVNLGDRLLFFDAFMTPEASLALRQVGEEINGRLPAYLINSHIHGDHTLGNQTFADLPIIATIQTHHTFINRLLPAINREKANPDSLKQMLDDLAAQLEAATSATQHRLIAERIARENKVYEALPTLQATPPTLTFTDKLTFYGSQRRAELITLGGGHSSSDAFLFLPDDGIIFMGDLLFVNSMPFLGDGDPDNWSRILDDILQLEAHIYVPGHGPVGQKRDLRRVQQHIAEMQALVARLIAAGVGVEEAINHDPTPAFADCPSDLLADDIRFLYSQHQSKTQ